MKSKVRIKKPRRGGLRGDLGQIMKCLCTREQLTKVDNMIPSSESLATKDFSLSGYSSKASDGEKKPDTRNIEEAELSLRESSSLNYEEARALLGRIEYQKGNIEAALHVFEGIDIAAITPKMKLSLARRVERRKRRSHDYAPPAMSIHAVSLLLEAIFLKAKSLQHLQRFKEAAQTCKVILDIVESSLPEGLPENFSADCKLQETLNKAVELLPELWKHSDSPHEAILSYRRALLHRWNLDAETTARIQKQFAIFLLYCGGEASPPNLRSQMDSSFVPRNNIEEAILLLMILLKKIFLKRIEWDPSILDHLSFALSIAGDLRALANQIKGLLPGIINRKERCHILALCYYGAGEDLVALDLLRKLLSSREDPQRVPALLVASRICGEKPNLAEEGINFACRALESMEDECSQLEGTGKFLLGMALSAHSKSSLSESERFARQSEALQSLESAAQITCMKDPNILYYLSLGNAEQRKLEAALYYAKSSLKLEAGSNVKGWLLLARILSAQKRFVDGEIVINAALDQTGKWDQGELLRTKAKLQIAQGQLKSAVETYTQLLAVLQVQSKSYGSGKKLHKDCGYFSRSFEQEIWHDLAYLYISLSQWRDAEICLSKSKAISSYSAVRNHATGLLYERKGLLKEALKAFQDALDIDPSHVPSLMSAAGVLSQQLGSQSNAVIKSLLMNALRVDRTNPSAWYNLGLLHKAENTASSLEEAAECFEAAAILEDSAPVEPFR
ncbi:Tetratricopeptide-like helical [Corchorus capsularis]|uniref:Tetratricopeptide-like helical n=1 Tax=Corchorus capsularis TaxID=210143 RepID=A0A1R3JP79_COCAP|nr:Tetratricopeptide-like helical [Corchorus capsularis]